METIRPCTAFSWGSLRYFVLLFHFWKFVNFINRSDIRLKNAICAEWGALLLGEERFPSLLMQNWPGRRSVFRSTEKKKVSVWIFMRGRYPMLLVCYDRAKRCTAELLHILKLVKFFFIDIKMELRIIIL